MFKTPSRQVFFLVTTILFLFSCRKHDVQSAGSLSLSSNSIRLDTSLASQTTVTVKSTVSWKAEISRGASWLAIDLASGGPGNTVVRLLIMSNNGTADPQIARVTFTAVGNSDISPVTLLVTQRPYSFNLGFRKSLGGSRFDGSGSQMVRLPDGGVVIAGTVFSNDGDVHVNHGGTDAWIVRLNSVGDTVWTKTYGGSLDDGATAIVATADGGFAAVGTTKSNDGDVHGNHGGVDLWLLKLNANGDTIFTKTYGGSGDEGNGSILSTPDGGYAIAGYNGSNDGDVQDNHGTHDVWLLKVNATGSLIWSRSFGGSNVDEARTMTQTADGGYVLAGLTASNDKDVTGYHVPTFLGFDMWIVKVDASGNKIWARTVGGTSDDVAIAIAAVNNGFIVTGYSNSADGDVTGYHGPADSPFFYDALVVKLDDSGNKQWVRDFGGTFDDDGLAIVATPDGGCVVAGGAESSDGDLSTHNGNIGTLDIWLFKLDDAGNRQWQKTIGSNGDDYCFSLNSDPDGFIITGLTNGDDVDMSGTPSHGDYDIWVGKLLVN